MENILLMKESKEIINLSKELGFNTVNFVSLIKAETPKELLKMCKGKGLKVYKPKTEKMLRFALEKAPIDIVLGVEDIHYKDSVHYLRGGLDQILCKIAVNKGKSIGISFSDVLKDRSKLGRIMFNLKICKKYGVKVVFNNFSLKKEEIRSAEDLQNFLKLLSR